MACACIAKLIIVLINVIFMIIGLTFAVAGIILIAAQDLIDPLLDSFVTALDSVGNSANLNTTVVTDTTEVVAEILAVLDTFAIVLVVFGLFMLIVTILAMCGSCCSVKILLIIYAVIVLAIFVTHLVVFCCVVFGVFADDVRGLLVTALETQYTGITGVDVASLVWNFLMISYKCCGVDNYEDFNNAEKWVNEQTFEYNGATVTEKLITPIACCITEGSFPSVTPIDDECSYKPSNDNNNWNTGCWDALNNDLINANRDIFIGVNVGVMLFELILAALAILVIVLEDKAKVSPV